MQNRGQFLKILAKNNISNLEDMAKIEFYNYKYNENLSNKENIFLLDKNIDRFIYI